MTKAFQLKRFVFTFFLFAFALIGFQNLLWADLKVNQVYQAEGKKNRAYIQEGVVSGGDRLVRPVEIKNLRHSKNSDFERIVIDLDTFQKTEKKGVVSTDKFPYFQISIQSEEKQVSVSIWGNPRLEFDPKKILSFFQKSDLIETTQLYPKVEESLWTFNLKLKVKAEIEVFELTDPLRIILDLKKVTGS